MRPCCLAKVSLRPRPTISIFQSQTPCRRRILRRDQHTTSQESHLPRFAQPSIWDSIIPKGLRSRLSPSNATSKKKPTNPATYFIWIYLLIGSQAIRIMGVKNDSATFIRKADLKLEKLREVVGKLQRGEEVDVEKVLGSGDELQELEWEEALRELQEQDRVWQNNRRKAREEEERSVREEQDANPVNDSPSNVPGNSTTVASTKAPVISNPGFY